MKTISLLIALMVPICSMAQYKTAKQETEVEIYELDDHKKRKAVGRWMEIVRASGVLTYVVMQARYNKSADEYKTGLYQIESAVAAHLNTGIYEGWSHSVLDGIKAATNYEVRYFKSHYPSELPKYLLPASIGGMTLGITIEMASLRKLHKSKKRVLEPTTTESDPAQDVIVIYGL